MIPEGTGEKINCFHMGAQPIDPHVFLDEDGTAYLYYGGWHHCNIAVLNEDMVSLKILEDGSVFREVTPKNYVEAPCMIKRNGTYCFMWSEGGWTGPDYCVAYALADSPFGPFERVGKILQQDPEVGTGAGHHGFLNVPGTEEWYIVYHRHPLGAMDGNHWVMCIDRMYFNEDGTIQTVKLTFEGVPARPLK